MFPSSRPAPGKHTQALVFWLVAASFCTLYITQPVLPVLREEFGVSASMASLSVSAVVFGIALANLPFGVLADRHSIRPILFWGALVVGAASLFCAWTSHFVPLIAARFVQGLFFPALTTCLAAYLSRTLPPERLNVVMGSYVAATTVGGLGGRLLAGFIHPPLHWRYAFVSAAVLLIGAAVAAYRWLPPDEAPHASRKPETFLELLRRPELLRIFAVGFTAFFAFSSVFNYMPFYLSAPPMNAPVQTITLLYLSYVAGVIAAPLSGKVANRIGSGAMIASGAAVFALSLLVSLIPSLAVVPLSLTGVCIGFFAMHASAVALLNRRLSASRGRANSLYTLFYYLGGAAGISATGFAWTHYGWPGAVALAVTVLAIPMSLGWYERRIFGDR